MNVRLIAVSRPVYLEELGDRLCSAEDLMVFCARVSSPQNQPNLDTGERLLRYCIRNSHWSVFETASMTVEITTSRAISAQIIRHRSFAFQEFSQRYSEIDLYEQPELRGKHKDGNRQGSSEDIGYACIPGTAYTAAEAARWSVKMAFAKYKELLSAGVAPECARMILPMCTQTRLYMTGSVRSWIHYLKTRLDAHAQKEHRQVAEAILEIFAAEFPVTYRAAFENEGGAK